MTKTFRDEQFLRERNGWYHYQRHVPTKLRAFYPSKLIRVTLNTKSIEIAKMRRDELALADDEYWAELKLSLASERSGNQPDTTHAATRYEIAKQRALAAGFKFRPIDQLADPSQIEDIVKRRLAVESSQTSDGRLNPVVVDAVLGGVEEPSVKVSEAMKIYQDEIMVSALRGKSRAQLKLWRQTKDRSLRYLTCPSPFVPVDAGPNERR